jgi:hemerythrin-like domain-containing protein
VKCTEHLMQDHKIIRRALDILQSMTEGRKAETIDAADAMILLRFLRVFADEHHHMKEEGLLFPELMRTSEAQGGPLRQLFFEHHQERSLVEGLEDALRSTKPIEFARFANRLISRIRDHIEKEDGILFPILEALLSKDQDNKSSVEFQKVQLDPALMAVLQVLESKYLRKTMQ